VGFSLLSDFLPFHPFLTQLSPPLIPIICISSLMSSIHLFLGLPLFLLPVGVHSSTLLGIYITSLQYSAHIPGFKSHYHTHILVS
jgi:hypothetical protein